MWCIDRETILNDGDGAPPPLIILVHLKTKVMKMVETKQKRRRRRDDQIFWSKTKQKPDFEFDCHHHDQMSKITCATQKILESNNSCNANSVIKKSMGSWPRCKEKQIDCDSIYYKDAKSICIDMESFICSILFYISFTCTCFKVHWSMFTFVGSWFSFSLNIFMSYGFDLVLLSLSLSLPRSIQFDDFPMCID